MPTESDATLDEEIDENATLEGESPPETQLGDLRGAIEDGQGDHEFAPGDIALENRLRRRTRTRTRTR